MCVEGGWAILFLQSVRNLTTVWVAGNPLHAYIKSITCLHVIRFTLTPSRQWNDLFLHFRLHQKYIHS